MGTSSARQSRRRPVYAETALLIDITGTPHRLRFWSEAEWDALPETLRPAKVAYSDHLGCWVGAVRLERPDN